MKRRKEWWDRWYWGSRKYGVRGRRLRAADRRYVDEQLEISEAFLRLQGEAMALDDFYENERPPT